MLSLQSFLRKGVSFGYVGRKYKLKNLKDHQLSTEQFPVSAYVGSSKNLQDLKDLKHHVVNLFWTFFTPPFPIS